MADTKDFTVVISIGKFPFAEICVVLFRYYYPEIKIIVAFDLEDQWSQLREGFLKKRNIQVAPNKFGMYHGPQLDRMINEYVQTKYFIVMDDDCFMKRSGIIENIN